MTYTMPRGVSKQTQRDFVVIAEDDKGVERVGQVMAHSHDQAVRGYQDKYSYTVTAVALLGGSGHPLHRG